MSNLTFEEVLNTPQGDYVDGGFVAVLRMATNKDDEFVAGKSKYGSWSLCDLYNPDDESQKISAMVSRDVTGLHNDKVHIYSSKGKGGAIKMGMDRNQEHDQLSIGGKVFFEPLGGAGPKPAQNASQGPSNAVQSAPSAREESIYTQVAYKAAIDIYCAYVRSGKIKDFDVKQETAWIWDQASRQRRILVDALLAGKYAPKNEFEGAEMPEELTGEKGEEL